MITALFDGRCVICQTTRRIIKTFDWLNRVEFVDLHNRALVQQRFPQLDHERMMGEIHVLEAQGRIFGGFDATRRMLRELPLGFPLWLILQLPFMRPVGIRVYRWIAKNRYAVNRWFGVELAPEDDGCVDGVCKLPQ